MPPERRQLLLLPGAADDLASFYDPLYTRIVRQLRILTKFPNLGKPMGPEYPDWRCLVVDLFFVVYRPTRRGIEVGQIRHTKRHPVTLEDLER